jgi:ribonuclease-3
LGLEEFLIVGKGMEATANVPVSLLADVFESLVAAIYLDSGIEASKIFIQRYLESEIELVAAGAKGENHKSQLQQLAQREFGSTPTYRLLDQKGPDHSKCFQVAAQVGERTFDPAWGSNKKQAEQRAAKNALVSLLRRLGPGGDATSHDLDAAQSVLGSGQESGNCDAEVSSDTSS